MNTLLELINKLDQGIGLFLKPLVAALSLFCAFAMVTGIVAREVFSSPLLGLEELILLAVMWLYMLGAALASRERSHLSGDFIQALSDNAKTIKSWRFVASCISLMMAAIFALWSFSLFRWGFEHLQSTAVFRIPLYAAQSSLFVCAVFFVFYGIRDVITDYQAIGHKAANL